MPDGLTGNAAIGAIRCGECAGEMYPADDRGERGAGLYTVECAECGSMGGVNVENVTVYGAVDDLEIVGEE